VNEKPMHILGTFQAKKKEEKKENKVVAECAWKGNFRNMPSDVGSLSEKPECNEKYKSLYSGLGKLKGKRSLCM